MSKKDEYFARAESWAISNQVQAERSRRTAWIISGLVLAVAIFEAVALALLTPLKTVQPVTLLVDRQTGFVQALDPVAPRRLAADPALTRSFLAQYVSAREGFDRAVAAADYRKVALWSADRARSSYLSVMPATNPASPFQRYPAGTVVRVRVKSVSQISAGVALVRFDTWIEDFRGRSDPPQPWISRVRYRFVDAPMSFDDRLVNPLGFQILSYIRDAEAPEPTPTAVRPNAASISTAQPLAVTTAPISAVSQSPTRTVPQLSSVPLRTVPSRSVRSAVASARQAPVQLAAEPTVPERSGSRREVPINQLPMGSPLSGRAQ